MFLSSNLANDLVNVGLSRMTVPFLPRQTRALARIPFLSSNAGLFERRLHGVARCSRLFFLRWE